MVFSSQLILQLNLSRTVIMELQYQDVYKRQTSIRAMRSNVQATLDATLKGLQITKDDLAREASRYSRRISDAPTQERQFVSIARQQEIKAGLYLTTLLI